MKIHAILLLGFLAGAVSLPAADAFDPPSFVKELDDLNRVMKKATKENKGVTFLLMEPGSR